MVHGDKPVRPRSSGVRRSPAPRARFRRRPGRFGTCAGARSTVARVLTRAEPCFQIDQGGLPDKRIEARVKTRATAKPASPAPSFLLSSFASTVQAPFAFSL